MKCPWCNQLNDPQVQTNTDGTLHHVGVTKACSRSRCKTILALCYDRITCRFSWRALQEKHHGKEDNPGDPSGS